MKYKVGDKVRIKNIDWYNKNKSKSHGTVTCGCKYFDYDMKEWCGKTMTILTAYQTCYIMQEDGAKNLWTDEMIEDLYNKELSTNNMAKKYGISDTTISNKRKSLGIESKGAPITWTDEMLKDLYNTDLTHMHIAEKYGISDGAVSRKRKSLGIVKPFRFWRIYGVVVG